MQTTMNDIRGWIREYDNGENSHVLIVCDTYDYEDYPVPVKKGTSPTAVIAEYNTKEMQRVMEVYNLQMDIEEQLKNNRSWNDQPYIEEKTMTIVPIEEEERKRSSWALTWMSMALQYANHRSIDPATRHGCIIVSEDNKPLSMGFNSFPRDCEDDKLPLTRPEKYEVIVHSETNAIINSERSLEGATVYVTGFPCPRCFSNMLNAKIKRIVYGPIGSHQLRESDIELIRQMNISAKTGQPKIEIIKYSDIEDLEKLCDSYDYTKQYIQSKMERADLING